MKKLLLSALLFLICIYCIFILNCIFFCLNTCKIKKNKVCYIAISLIFPNLILIQTFISYDNFPNIP